MPAVKRGHAILGISDADILFGAGDSFVAERDVHWPTDISLLRDAVRGLILRSNTWARKRLVPGTRESEDDKKKLEKAFKRVRKEKRANRLNANRISSSASSARGTRKSRPRAGGRRGPPIPDR